MNQFLIVAAGGAVGAALRHGVNLGAGRLFGAGFPYGTFAVNVAGSLAMGLIAGWLALRSGGQAETIRLFAMTGVLGGFTTFSAFSMDAVALWERGAPALAAAYVTVSVVLSIAALGAGLTLARGFA
jgi:fluoride exporter